MIRKIEMENWNTTSILRRLRPLKPVDSLPFNTSTGRNAERKNAGYAPAIRLTIITKIIAAGASQVNVCLVKASSFPDTWLNKGSKSHAIITAAAVATNVTSSDSVKNCAIKLLRGEPSTLRTPTSRARLEERAVDKFIKLTQAIRRIKQAIDAKTYKTVIFPFAEISFPISEWR